jgi:hypothetical protein
MSCIIRAGVCRIQVSYYIATVFVVVLHLHCFCLVIMSIPCIILLDFIANYELRDIYSDYVSVMLFHPKCISLQQNYEALLRVSLNRCVRRTCTIVLASWRFHFFVVTCVFAVYVQIGKFISFCAYEILRLMNLSTIPHLKVFLYKLISCSIQRHLFMFVVK